MTSAFNHVYDTRYDIYLFSSLIWFKDILHLESHVSYFTSLFLHSVIFDISYIVRILRTIHQVPSQCWKLWRQTSCCPQNVSLLLYISFSFYFISLCYIIFISCLKGLVSIC